MSNLVKLALLAAICGSTPAMAGPDPDADLRQRLGLGAQDSGVVLSQDKLAAYFVREFPDRTVHSEIWRISLTDRKTVPLVRAAPSSDPKRNLVGFLDPRLSPDSQILYFRTEAWATSTAIHAIDLNTGKIAFVTAGNSLHVVQKGRYKGHLIVEKHRYYIGGGSYDGLWLVTAGGAELGPVSDIDTVEAN